MTKYALARYATIFSTTARLARVLDARRRVDASLVAAIAGTSVGRSIGRSDLASLAP
jgi:hypothetical protein